MVSDANLTTALPSLNAGQSFDVSVTKGGVTSDVTIDLSQVQGDLTLDNVVNTVNQQLSAAGFASRFQRVMTDGTADDPTTASYGISINTAARSTPRPARRSASRPPPHNPRSMSPAIAARPRPPRPQRGQPPPTSRAARQARCFGLRAASRVQRHQRSRYRQHHRAIDRRGCARQRLCARQRHRQFRQPAESGRSGRGAVEIRFRPAICNGRNCWARPARHPASSLAVDPTGGVVVAGATTADLTTTAIADGNNDSFVTKYAADGSQTWTTQIQTLNKNQANSVSVDATGNVYIGGQVTGVIGAGQTNAAAATPTSPSSPTRARFLTSSNSALRARTRSPPPRRHPTAASSSPACRTATPSSPNTPTATPPPRPSGRWTWAICKAARSAASRSPATMSMSRARRRTARSTPPSPARAMAAATPSSSPHRQWRERHRQHRLLCRHGRRGQRRRGRGWR